MIWAKDLELSLAQGANADPSLLLSMTVRAMVLLLEPISITDSRNPANAQDDDGESFLRKLISPAGAAPKDGATRTIFSDPLH